jgi:hypothetical protein
MMGTLTCVRSNARVHTTLRDVVPQIATNRSWELVSQEREPRPQEEERPMTEHRVINKSVDRPKEVQQSATDRVALTLSDAVATRGLSLTVKTHLKAGLSVKQSVVSD